ncbi:hypothetical protein ScPMuIL_014602 [Solemya velum]
MAFDEDKAINKQLKYKKCDLSAAIGRLRKFRRPTGNYPSTKLTTLMSPDTRHKTSSNSLSRRERTPNTVLRMMERHRENERVRHHTLNELMRSVCRRVPGFKDASKETKVVMMQRIIGYIFYLENTIQALCNDLHIWLNFSTSFISNNWKRDPDGESDDEFCPIGVQHQLYIPLPPAKKQIVARKHLRRKKISSPTVDSTTDCLRETHLSYSEKSATSSQDSNAPAPSCIPYSADSVLHSPIYMECSDNEKEPIHDDINTLLQSHSIYDDTSLRLPSFTKEDDYPTSTISLDLLSSPNRDVDKENMWLGCRNSPQAIMRLGNSMGIHCDSSFSGAVTDVHDAHMASISPDSVLPTKFLAGSYNHTDSDEEYRIKAYTLPEMSRIKLSHKGHKTPLKVSKNKRKQYTPVANRSPFHNITNWVTASTEIKLDPQLSPLQKKSKTMTPSLPGKVIKKGHESYQSFVPYIWNIHNSATTRRQKAVAAKHDQKSTVERECTDDRSSKINKIDHRKTTWMNGFMMFSRLNRRTFIAANPGVHTSHISKMMGHAWRNMSEDEQQPYKDKAKDYTSGIRDTPQKYQSTINSDSSNDSVTVLTNSSQDVENNPE